MKDLHLYEIADEILSVVEAEEFDGDLIEQLSMAFEKKAESILAWKDKMSSFVQYCKDEEARIAAKRKTAESRVAWLNDYLKNNMEAAGIMSLDIGTKTIKIQNNPPSCIIDDEGEVDARFFVVVPETKRVDKAAVKKALNDGPVAGARLETTTRLVVK